MKLCTECKALFPLSAFSTPDGRGGFKAQCVDCCRLRNRRYKAAKRARRLAVNREPIAQAFASWRGPVNREPMRWAA